MIYPGEELGRHQTTENYGKSCAHAGNCYYEGYTDPTR